MPIRFLTCLLALSLSSAAADEVPDRVCHSDIEIGVEPDLSPLHLLEQLCPVGTLDAFGQELELLAVSPGDGRRPRTHLGDAAALTDTIDSHARNP